MQFNNAKSLRCEASLPSGSKLAILMWGGFKHPIWDAFFFNGYFLFNFFC